MARSAETRKTADDERDGRSVGALECCSTLLYCTYSTDCIENKIAVQRCSRPKQEVANMACKREE